MARIPGRQIDEYRVIYSDHQGTPHEAIQLPWDVVTDILGWEHRGTGEDDALLVDVLLQTGAPEWVRDAEGWVDEHGWGLIGPAIDEDVVTDILDAEGWVDEHGWGLIGPAIDEVADDD